METLNKLNAKYGATKLPSSSQKITQSSSSSVNVTYINYLEDLVLGLRGDLLKQEEEMDFSSLMLVVHSVKETVSK